MSAHTIEELSPTRRKFKITVPVDDVRKSWDKVLQETQSTAEIRGFRKGKAPLSLIKKVNANDIAKKVINNLVNEFYSAAVKESKLQILNQPNIEPEGEFSEKEDFVFSAVVDVYTQVEIKDYKGLSLTLPEVLGPKAEEAEYEKALELEKKHRSTQNAATSSDTEQTAEKTESAEVSQEAQDLLQKELKSYFNAMRSQSAYMQIVDQVLEKNSFEVADVLVEQMIDQLIYNSEVVQGKKDPKSVPTKDKEFRDSYRERAEKQVKAVMALTHIAQQEKIEVPQEELFKSVSQFLEKNKLNFQQMRDNQKMILQEHRSEILLLKASEFIIEHANITWEAKKEEPAEETKKEETENLSPASES